MRLASYVPGELDSLALVWLIPNYPMLQKSKVDQPHKSRES